MIVSLVVALSAGPAALPVPDTVLILEPGEVVVLENGRGSLLVEEGEPGRLEVTGGPLELRRSGSRVVVDLGGPAGRGGESGRRDDRIVRVPGGVDLRLRSRALDVTAVGREGPLDIELLSGSIRLDGTRGPVRVATLAGAITSEDTHGALTLSSHGGDIRVVRGVGPVVAESLSGTLSVEASRAPSVRAETQAGDVRFDGEVRSGGSYTFVTHSGDVTVRAPRGLDAQVAVSTFHGSFESDFPVLTRRFVSGEPVEFTVGRGGAHLRMEAFAGDIRLRGGP